MRILLLADGMYPFILGGMQKHSYSMAKYLSLSGIKVHVIQFVNELPKEVDPLSRNEFDDFKKENFQLTSLLFPKKKKIPGHYLRANLEFSRQAWKSIENKIHGFDFIYAQGFSGYQFIKEKQKKSHQVPVAVNFHGFEMFQQAPNFNVRLQHQLFRKTVKWMCKNADQVISYGGKITSLVQKLGIPSTKIMESPMGIDDSWFMHSPSDFNVKLPMKFLFIGRYERRKGIEELSAALKKLLVAFPDQFQFHFIGPIPEEKWIQNKQIIYHGIIRQQKEIQSISSDCDILLCPSYSEGMPTVILEGMASGNAVIATNVGAIALQITDNGWLLEKADEHLIFDALKKALELPIADLVKMKEKSYQRAENKFRWTIVVMDLIEKIQKYIQKK